LDLHPQLLFSRIKSEFDAMKVFATFIFAGKIKVGKTFMTSTLLFILENKSCGYKSQFQRNAYSLWSRQSQRKLQKTKTVEAHPCGGECFDSAHLL